MPTDKLAQVLEEQKMLGAEKDIVEVIARALRIRPALAARAVFLCRQLETRDTLVDWEKYIPTPELLDALKLAASLGGARLMVRQAIECSGTMNLLFKCLVSEADALQVCNGCPGSLTCLAQGLHTPQECCVTRRAVVYPLRFVTKQTVEVECAHPAGKFIVPLKYFTRQENP